MENLYSQIDEILIKKKMHHVNVVHRDFNEKVGHGKVPDIVENYGLSR